MQRVSDSCGYAVPLMTHDGDRDLLTRWADNRGDEGLATYRAAKNATSIDGLPALAPAPPLTRPRSTPRHTRRQPPGSRRDLTRGRGDASSTAGPRRTRPNAYALDRATADDDQALIVAVSMTKR